MMEKNLAIVDNLATLNDIQMSCFLAEKYGFRYLSVYQNYINTARQILHDVRLSALVDYPHGLSSKTTRLHAIVECLRKGVNAVDISINVNDVVNERYENIVSDLLAISNLATLKRTEIRAVLEYRLMDDEQIEMVAGLCSKYGIARIILGTGYLAENFFDNLLTANEIREFAIPVVNGVLNSTHLEMAEENEITSIQVTSHRLVNTIWGIKRED